MNLVGESFDPYFQARHQDKARLLGRSDRIDNRAEMEKALAIAVADLPNVLQK